MTFYFFFFPFFLFTGIIEITAEVLQKTKSGISIQRPEIFEELMLGQSIAVNGACLSVVEFDEKSMRFDVVPETFQRTNLADAEVVNLERALPANGRFEGHIVLGHVDTVTEILEQKKEGNGERWIFSLPEKFTDFFVPKGSITLNGISLTIAEVTGETFAVALIPQTLRETNFQFLKTGDKVNVETDIMAKYWRK